MSKMKFTPALVCLLLFSVMRAAPQDEIVVVEQLIETTQKNLDTQQALLKKMVEFKDAREAFLANLESGKLATALVKRAMELNSHLERSI